MSATVALDASAPTSAPVSIGRDALNPPSGASGEPGELGKRALPYVPALDGLRAALALCVVFAHANMAWLPGVGICMDAFFVLSGYLITSLLIGEIQRTGAVSLSRFYVRRLRRLFPPLIGIVACFVVLSLLFNPRQPMGFTESIVALTYTENYYYFFQIPVPLFNIGHLWSLAVEEQFYLLWPVAFLFIVGRWRISRLSVTFILGVAFAVAGIRAYVTYLGYPAGSHIYPVFHLRADSLLIGCALAFGLRLVRIQDHPRFATLLRYSLLPVACASIPVMLSLPHFSPAYFYYVSLLASLGTAVILAGLVSTDRSLLHFVLQNRALVFVGKMSYSLYLWHWPIYIWLIYHYQFDWQAPFWARVLLAWILAFLAAYLSYRLFERSIMSNRNARAAPAETTRWWRLSSRSDAPAIDLETLYPKKA